MSSDFIKTCFRVCLFAIILIHSSCSKNDSDLKPVIPITPQPPVATDVAFWLTSADQGTLFKKQNMALIFKDETNGNPTIVVDTTKTYQSIDGFGYTLTSGSASLIHSLSNDKRAALLKELFSTDSTFIGVSYLRISIGASDLSESPYTYDDVPNGQTDVDLAHFSLDAEMTHLIPLLKEILAINPAIKILGSPWSAPVWMKTNNNFVGGSLNTTYYTTYANYFVKYIQGMTEEGINIDAITLQNEPLNPHNNPSMSMSSSEQANFIKNNLGPAFATATINTKIILYDHNCDVPSYPLDILADPSANAYSDGSAFHLYGGNITALTEVHNAYPQKNVYFTEQWTSSTGGFAGDLNWHVKNLIIGATRNWSKNVLEWNLANDTQFGPHTDGGCTTCLGAITVGSGIARNVSYYIIAHASKFVRPGSVRVDSNLAGSLQNVAFQRADGTKVLIVLNDSNGSQTFNIKFKNKVVTASLGGGAVGTFVW
ncbi:MAG TPA: glycoside hydrolase family 30 beta sandwich domain-containing protein [Chryseolinea sp.]|nr:glycoside hydrolase family 30 beta sandwich domain-containing protein [Chryseolinea sp.]HPM30706.1 glycoside hydrolase family 30 beta sandwich domain-containing protein [Chryseolinea sp.]